jgi:RHS repeat-associated protein
VDDNAGNLTQVTRNGTPITMSYNNANELTSAGSTTYTYDANGNLTGSSAGMSATYNGQDQMSSITPAGGSATSQSYSDFGQFERISAGTGSYRYDVTGLSAMPSGGTYFVRTPDGQLLSERTASGTYYYLTDALGSVMALTNSTGAVVNTYAYDPYGATTATSGSTANVFGYGGQQLDSSSGLYKMGQRYYDPGLARWESQDLFAGGLSSPQSFNRYSSVLGNPVSLLDATGLCIPQGTYGPFTPEQFALDGGYCPSSIQLPITATVPLPFTEAGISWTCSAFDTGAMIYGAVNTIGSVIAAPPSGGASLFWTVNSVAGTAAGVMGCLNGW